jgi:inner membrane protein
VDNLTHSLCGWTLARAGLNRYGKWVTPLLIGLANLPDLETVLLPGHSRATYLLYHRGITHSFLMLTIYSIVFGSLLWFVNRRPDSRGPSRVFEAVGICAAALFSHTFLDSLNNYGVRPALPFNATWYYGDMIFIVDPWIWLMFGIPILAGSAFNRKVAAAWIVLAALTTCLMYFGIQKHLMPWPFLGVWLVVIVGATAFRRRGPANAERCARVGLLLFSLYLALTFVTSRTALDRAKANVTAAVPGAIQALVRTSVQPFPGQPWRYDVLLQTEDYLSHVNVNLLGESTLNPNREPLNLRDPALDAIRTTFEYRAWMGFARHPYALRYGNVLILGDARFKSMANDWTAQSVDIPPGK